VSTSTPSPAFPSGLRERAGLLLYRLVWWLLWPIVLIHFFRRGRKEPLYRRFMVERWGQVSCRLDRPVWVHCASLGELRGATPLIRALLADGYPVWISTLTAAGRGAIHKLFADELARGLMQASYVPLDRVSAVRRFIRTVRPCAALMTENDTWPVLLTTIRAEGVPLCMVNAQYSGKSLARDLRWGGFRAGVFRCYELVLCKSEHHAARFRHVGCPRLEVAGEIRFDYPIPQAQLDAARAMVERFGLAPGRRPVLALVSIIEGEEALIRGVMERLRGDPIFAAQGRPLFVLVPRQPHRFEPVASTLAAAGFRVLRRSQCLDTALGPLEPASGDSQHEWDQVDVLVGDSLGEMFFYLALAQVVVVGGSFTAMGAHNVIEPMALAKPVIVGPVIWTIEFPAVEALAAGALTQVGDADGLVAALRELFADPARLDAAARRAADFYARNAGATDRHMAALREWMGGNWQRGSDERSGAGSVDVRGSGRS